MNDSPRKIVVTHWVHNDVARRVAELGQPVLNSTRDTWPRAELIARCRDADALIAFMPDRIDAELLDACPRLRIVSGALKGYDNFDVDACTVRGVWVTIVPDLLTNPTADLALALLLVLTRRVMIGDQFVRSGRFAGWKPRFYGVGLDGATAGIVGYGAVGRALARRLRAFGCRVLFHDRQRPDAALEAEAEFHGMLSLLAESDFVFPLLPLTPETRHLFDASLLSRMKPGAFLVNCGRGSLVDEAAVAAALENGRLAGYGADVFAFEDWALADRPREIPPALLATGLNTVFTPHLGSAVDEVRREIAHEAVARVEEVFRGEKPRNAVNDLHQVAEAG